jgi:cytochrome P450
MVSSTVRTARVTAELVWFLASATRRADPYPAYARLRRLDPVHHSPIGVWLVSSHEEVSQLLRDPRLSSNEKHIDLDTLHLGPLRRLLGRADATETGAFFDRAQDPLLTVEARDAANTATIQLTAYLRALIGRRRHSPGDDLLSALIHTQDDPLSDDELISIALLLLIAGHETTANLLGNGIAALLAQPEAACELRNDPALDDHAVDELLRYDSPVQMTMRIATEHVEIGPRVIEPGAVLVLCTGAATHDPSTFPHPQRLDWHREPNPHLAFGGGIHYCLGAQLARTEARIGLRALLNRLADPVLDGQPVRRPSFTIRGLERLELAW